MKLTHDEVEQSVTTHTEKDTDPTAPEAEVNGSTAADPTAAAPKTTAELTAEARSAELPTAEVKAAEVKPATEAEAKPAAEKTVTAVPPSPPGADGPSAGSSPNWLPRSTRGRVLAGAAVVLVLALIGGAVYWFNGARLGAGVAFRVNGQDVTAAQLDDELRTDTALYGGQIPTDEPRLDKLHRDFAKSTAITMIMEKAAAERNVAVADSQASDVLSRYIAQYYGDSTDGHDKYLQALASQGTSEAKVLAEVKRQMLLQKLVAQVTAGITVSDQDVRQTFDQRRAQLATPQTRDIHNIVTRSKDDADQVMADLKAGANFEQEAKAKSQDGSTKDQGGNLGELAAGQLEKGFADAAFAAPVGALFGPVQTQYGWNVGRITSSRPGGPAVFEQIAGPLRQSLIAEKSAALWRDTLSKLLSDADVRYADNYRPADPDGLPPADQPDSGARADAGQAPAGDAPAGQAPAAPAPAGQAPALPAPPPAAPGR